TASDTVIVLPLMCAPTRSRKQIHLPPFVFFSDTATTEIYTLSLHDALPICAGGGCRDPSGSRRGEPAGGLRGRRSRRSEEHTSELQSHLNLVCRLLLEK